MIKSQLVDWLADERNTSRREAKQVVDDVLEAIARALVVDGHLAIRGFGTFEVRRRHLAELEDDSAPAGGEAGVSGVSFRPSGVLRSRLESRDRQT